METVGEEPTSKDFIREIIDADNASKKYHGRVHTRFPPEPNGYLHIGHAKSICLNFGIAEQYDGKCNLRFDDTNPAKEEEEYVQSIITDVKWLGFDWQDRLFYASDYFDQMYTYAEDLIKKGKAYVDDLTADQIAELRGTLTKPGAKSPYRDRPIDENLALFRRMKAGEFPDGSKVLRAKIDMNHPNLNMRDPVMYRILRATHHNTGDTWCIYPMYDWAHGLEDSIENITHSICTLEFENHRPLYDWFLDALGVYHPQQIEFARLNLTYTVMSKRLLLQLVEGKPVNGWDDPRLPTISGMRRRGYSPQASGRSPSASASPRSTAWSTSNSSNTASARTSTRPHRGTWASYDHSKSRLRTTRRQTEEVDAVNNPEDPDMGSRRIPFSKTLYIEQDDFMEQPPPKFYRLAPGREVRLRYAYFITCRDVVKQDGKVVELRCTYDPATKGGYAPDGRKVKSTIHWVSASDAVDAEVRLYTKLFTVRDPLDQKGADYKTFLNPQSLEILQQCKVEPAVKTCKPLDRFQFERLGYFCVDPDTTAGHLVLNRTTELRDTWGKIQSAAGPKP